MTNKKQEKLTPGKTSNKSSGETASESVSKYATTTAVLYFSDMFSAKQDKWTGWYASDVPNPTPPSGPHKWKLLSTNTERMQLSERQVDGKDGGKRYDVCYLAIIWTWQRVGGK